MIDPKVAEQLATLRERRLPATPDAAATGKAAAVAALRDYRRSGDTNGFGVVPDDVIKGVKTASK